MRWLHCVGGGGGAAVNFGRRLRRAASPKKRRRRHAGGQEITSKIPEKSRSILKLSDDLFLGIGKRNKHGIGESPSNFRRRHVDHQKSAVAPINLRRRLGGRTALFKRLLSYSSSLSSLTLLLLRLLLSSTFFLLLLFSFSSFSSSPSHLSLLLLV